MAGPPPDEGSLFLDQPAARGALSSPMTTMVRPIRLSPTAAYVPRRSNQRPARIRGRRDESDPVARGPWRDGQSAFEARDG
jgi:hypothetical protein